jgi:hypothetical protein
MSDTRPDAVPLKLRARVLEPRLPAVFGSATRSTEGGPDPFLPPQFLRPLATYDVGASMRGEGAAEERRAAAPDEVIVLELADGGVLVTSAARLRESLERARPELIGEDGALLLDRLRAGSGASRGIGDTLGALVQRVFSFAAGEVRDSIVEKALEKVTDPLVLGVSWAGTKALMWAIEERLDQPAGTLRRWNGGADFGGPAADASQPMLVFVHGTASRTRGSFGDLRAPDLGLWRALERQFPGGIFGFEHRTLSESPIDNAIALVQQLPAGATVSLVSHSRGGLVGDLLCLDPDGEKLDELIENYKYPFPRTGATDPAESERVHRELEDAHAAQRAQLAELRALLRTRRITVQRYVRVASPARGTLLASGNFDVFLSGLLSLIGMVPVLRASLVYDAFKRVVIEIAKNRTDPHLVPGIEAMLPDSPMAGLLRAAPVRAGTAMAVIAGDIEGGSLLQRLGTFLTDTLIFERQDNDLVVDTAAMLGGIAPRSGARVLFDRGAAVNHFNYFANPRTRGALQQWLLGDPAAQATFQALPAPGAALFAPDPVRRDGAPDTRPVVVVLPGVMGSHLAVPRTDGGNGLDRIWLDPLDIAKGGLKALQWGQPGVQAEDLFSLFYGKLCDRLQATHDVRRFPYDWRQPLDVLADRLAATLGPLLDATEGRPVRLLAHSMGGLVVRAAIHKHPTLMNRLIARPGARLVMCGTPHQGAHSMVENLIGKGDTLRALVRLDLANDMQDVLDIVAGFRGALALLPKPGFVDTFQGLTEDDGRTPVGGEFFDYQSAATWAEFRGRVGDFWFGDGKVGQPPQPVLDAAAWLWKQDGRDRPRLPAPYADKSVYVAGIAARTPCGVLRDKRGRLRMVSTSRGDGTVTWDSGRIDGLGGFYYLPAAHGDLLAKSEHFDALIELLAEGRTTRLATTPPVVRALEAEVPRVYDAGPPALGDPDLVARLALGAAPEERVTPQQRGELAVGVRAMDLRFLRGAILVGHYDGDPIAGAEALIDRELVRGELRARHDLGLYPGPQGTAAALLMPPDRSGQRSGAVVVGLGTYDGTLALAELTDAVRAGALRYLLHCADVIGRDQRVPPLSALLLGYNSTASLSIATSVEALVRGVVEANRRFAEITRSTARIERLDLVELYRDTAISAHYALAEAGPLRERLEAHAAAQGQRLVIAPALVQAEGARQRLHDRGAEGWWPNLFISGIAAPDDAAAADDAAGASAGAESAATATPPPLPAMPRRRVADRLRFVFVGQRARAEAVVQQRQPGLLEDLVRRQVHIKTWQPDFGRALFQLTVPQELKDTLRQSVRASLVLDATTANLPWEMLLADDPARGGEATEPLAVRMALVRRFETTSFRRRVQQSLGRNALVIGNPSCEGYVEAFPPPPAPGTGKPRPTLPPPPLPGAEKEAETVAARLRGLGYEVERAIGDDQTATDVLVRLYRKPWRILHISAHGVFAVRHRDGLPRSGVVLSDGFLITAAELRAMESVPELVFLNCCHLGQVDAEHEHPLREPNRLAASVARELIDSGVRCVVVAGWAVTDTLAERFGSVFYDELLSGRRAFGDAVHAARRALWDAEPDDITWAAFQAYGDPDWRPERDRDGGASRRDGYFASPEEVLDALAGLRVALSRRDEAPTAPELEERRREVERVFEQRCRPEWRGQAELQSALGATWFALGEFGRAREAYLAALAASGPRGVVPVHDIEKLANAEARLGEQTDEPALADLALLRLEMVERVTAPLLGAKGAAAAGAAASASPRHGELASLRGSAWKIKAGACAAQLVAAAGAAQLVAAAAPATSATRARAAPATSPSPSSSAPSRDTLVQGFLQALQQSAAAYGSVEGVPGQPGFDPYPALNRLALEAVLGFEGKAAQAAGVDVARACGAAARARLERGFDVWQAIMVPEAELTERVVDGSLALPGEPGRRVAHELLAAYRAQFAGTPIKPVELDSVLSQFRKTARLWRGLAQVDAKRAAGASLMAARLEWLGAALAGKAGTETAAPLEAALSAAVTAAPASPPTTASPAAPTSPAPPARSAKRPARARKTPPR